MLSVLTWLAQQELPRPQQKLPRLGKKVGARIGRVNITRRDEVARCRRYLATDAGLRHAILKSEVLVTTQLPRQGITPLLK